VELERGPHTADVIEIADSQPSTPPRIAPGESDVISLLTQDVEFEPVAAHRQLAVPLRVENDYGILPRYLTPSSRPPCAKDAVASFLASGNLLHKVGCLHCVTTQGVLGYHLEITAGQTCLIFQ
jgi:hypothetical protein